MRLLNNYDDVYYEEVGQTRPCRFAYAIQRGEDVEVLHKPVKCRDFLNDTLVWKSGERPEADTEVYGYNYRGHIDYERLCLVVTEHKHSDYRLGHSGRDLLLRVEQDLGLEPTAIVPIERDCLVTADKFWMKNTVLMSWYTSMLRALSYGNNPQTWEELNLDNMQSTEFRTVPYKLAKVDNGITGSKNKNDIHLIHDQNGWWTATNKYTSQFNNYGKMFHA